jgi:hypothetical protein
VNICEIVDMYILFWAVDYNSDKPIEALKMNVAVAFRAPLTFLGFSHTWDFSPQKYVIWPLHA